MADIRRILVGMDFADQTHALIEHAQFLAQRHGAEVILAHALYLGLETPLGHLTGSAYPEFLYAQQQQAREQLSRARSCFAPGVRVSQYILEGNPAPTLAIAADELDADIVLVGSHEGARRRTFLIGSVAERTVRFTERTVMVVRGGTPPSQGFHRILVPTDFSPAAEEALETSFLFASPDARIEVLHCWVMPVYQGSLETSTLGMVMAGSDMEREVSTHGIRLLEQFKNRGPALSFRQVENKAAYGIHDRLESAPFDLVVMGSHGRSGFGRWLIGSVAEVTVRHAPCSVVAVKSTNE